MPDQLDQRVAMAINEVRRATNQARARLNLHHRLYPVEDASTIFGTQSGAPSRKETNT